MAVLLKCGAIFLHIPKTGGNWIIKMLEENDLVFAHIGEKHANMDQMNSFEHWFRIPEKYSKPFKSFYKFCFVRNPFKWYESWYKMQSITDWPKWGANPDIWHPGALLDETRGNRFDEFISNVLDKRPGYLTEMYGWYTMPGINFIGKQEHLADHLIHLLKILNVRFDEQKIRASEPVNVSKENHIEWKPELKNAIAYTESAVLQRFGYNVDGSDNIPGSYLIFEKKPMIDQSAREDSETSTPRVYGPELKFSQVIPLKEPFTNEIGFAWNAPLNEYISGADNLDDPYRSTLILLEDGKPLLLRHILHDDIRKIGLGRYSHWNNSLIFSTSDNSNPNTNGRTYQIAFAQSGG